MVYLIHFDQPYLRVQHYIGYCRDDLFEQRMQYHRSGRGSCLMRAVTQAGIEWRVVRIWPDADGNFERRLKNRKKAAKLCPVCYAKALSNGREDEADKPEKIAS
jgi:predicted GIY-YIG superfamily endonuclease